MNEATKEGSPTTAESNTNTTSKQQGSCHCGAVRFEADVDLRAGATRCNCTICTKLSSFNGVVKPDSFRLLAGEDSLSTYEWGGKSIQRYFCKHCGVHCFGRGHLAELGGDYVAINYNCLDAVELDRLKVAYWDGRHDNWLAGPRDTPWPIISAW